MTSKIKYLAIATVVAVTTASGAFAQERGGPEQGGIKLPSLDGGGAGGGVQYGVPRLDFPVPFPTPRPLYRADDFIDEVIVVMPVSDNNDKPKGESETTSPKDGSDQLITYDTPRFGGFQPDVSYPPPPVPEDNGEDGPTELDPSSIAPVSAGSLVDPQEIRERFFGPAEPSEEDNTLPIPSVSPSDRETPPSRVDQLDLLDAVPCCQFGQSFTEGGTSFDSDQWAPVFGR